MHRRHLPAALLLAAACAVPGSAGAPPASSDARAAAPPAAAAERGSEWVERTLAGLSLRQKAAQMVMPWSGAEYVSTDSPEWDRLRTLVRDEGVGGIIMSIGLPHTWAAKTNALQREARVPLLVATDLESGPGMRLAGVWTLPHLLPQGGGTVIPPAMALAATGSDTLAFQVGRAIGREARAVGIRMTLAPVLDVNSNPANPIINTRSYGEDPAEVARLGTAFVRGARAGGVLTAAKHFPGHGDTHTDSHVALPTLPVDRARLDSVELVPFRAAVAAGVDAVLVGHLAAPRVAGAGDRPASLNAFFVDGLLRREMGFGGLVVTDALIMGALTRRYGAAEAAVLAVVAGSDVLLQPVDAKEAIDAVVAAVRSGRLTEARLDASVRRLLAAKERAGLSRATEVDVAAVERVVGSRAHRALAEEVARRSMVLARDARSLVPFRRGGRVLSITYADATALNAGRFLDAALAEGGATVESVRTDERTTPAEWTALRERAARADRVVAAAYVTPREGRGNVAAGVGFTRWTEAAAADGLPVVAVSFGSPYLLTSFPSAPAYLLAWTGEEVSQRAAARALLGTAPVTGRLPVSVPPLLSRGAGLRRSAP